MRLGEGCERHRSGQAVLAAGRDLYRQNAFCSNCRGARFSLGESSSYQARLASSLPSRSFTRAQLTIQNVGPWTFPSELWPQPSHDVAAINGEHTKRGNRKKREKGEKKIEGEGGESCGRVRPTLRKLISCPLFIIN